MMGIATVATDEESFCAGMLAAAQMLNETRSSIRLHAGEMTAQEMRSVMAVLHWKKREIEAAANKRLPKA